MYAFLFAGFIIVVVVQFSVRTTLSSRLLWLHVGRVTLLECRAGRLAHGVFKTHGGSVYVMLA
jgi:hypothetical protein